jgi:hypothetical protein
MLDMLAGPSSIDGRHRDPFKLRRTPTVELRAAQRGSLSSGPGSVRPAGGGIPVGEAIEEPRVVALEDRGDEKVLDVERPSPSQFFTTT